METSNDVTFDSNTEALLGKAVEFSKSKNLPTLSADVVFLYLLRDTAVVDLFDKCGMLSSEYEVLRGEVGNLVVREQEHSQKAVDYEVRPDKEIAEIIYSCMITSTGRGITRPSSIDLLYAFLSASLKYKKLFKDCGINYLAIMDLCDKGQTKRAKNKTRVRATPSAESVEGTQNGPPQGGYLASYTRELTDITYLNECDPCIGRLEELKQMQKALCRRKKRNVVLIGEPGVGKTVLVQGLADLVLRNKVPSQLTNTRIFELDLNGLAADTTLRGMLEGRVDGVIKELRNIDGSVLFIDEVHSLMSGASTGGHALMNTFKPKLADGSLRLIGATTLEEYRKYFESDKAFTRRFSTIQVDEPSKADTVKIIKGLKKKMEDHYKLGFSDEAVQSATDLSSRYIHNRYLPDKAIDVLEEAGAHQQLIDPLDRVRVITRREIEESVARIARIPSANLELDSKKVLLNLNKSLKKSIIGQDQAVDTLVDLLMMHRAGLRDETKPIASLLFAGPTGVGKTEICKQLAKNMGIPFIRFDMSEFQERHTVSKLVGSPPGYVGYNEGGQLTEAVNKEPYSIVLLDEIEKAHFDIYNVLLQVMDYGKLTDGSGRTVDFRHVLLVMTTNQGAAAYHKKSVGFLEDNKKALDSSAEINIQFPPEFRNRLNGIVHFNTLSRPVILRIVDNMLDTLFTRLDGKHVELVVSKNAKQWLATNGYDEHMGARPMARIIEEAIAKPLAKLIITRDKNPTYEKPAVFIADVVGDELLIEEKGK